MEYKSFDPWTTFPKDVCTRCGYSGSFAIEWDNDTLMADYHPDNIKHRKKEASKIEGKALRSTVGFFAIIMIITYILIFVMILAMIFT